MVLASAMAAATRAELIASSPAWLEFSLRWTCGFLFVVAALGAMTVAPSGATFRSLRSEPGGRESGSNGAADFSGPDAGRARVLALLDPGRGRAGREDHAEAAAAVDDQLDRLVADGRLEGPRAGR